MKRILVVDDEFTIVDSLAELLEAEGYLVTTATDPSAALAQLSAENPSLLLVDFMMPVMNGLEMIERIRADSRLDTLKIVLMTAAPPPCPPGDPPWDRLLRKPFGIDVLCRVLEELLGPVQR